MPRTKARWAVPLAACTVIALGAAVGVAAADSAPDAVTISNFAYAPPALTVTAGTKVIWTNDDNDAHTVTSADAGRTFKSPALDTGDTFSFTFDKPGTYKYFCSLHTYMVGTIDVK